MDKNLKQITIVVYLVIGFFYAIYQHFWGLYSYKGFAFNLGQGLAWPFIMFPTLGKIVGGILILLFIIFIVLKPK
ncbi:hypothetical protein N0P26_002970 [Acinetobacter baumannii]|uniref:Uncharacterized protein n=4 Tax=Acinetobacter baumannii TaxID=470 RepID=D0CE04_ACIB2|nr:MULTISPECIES: hypothetical protein [Acinetobacter]EXG35417.1 putative membrane protein [Acinetobacter baumannii 121738]AIL75018.1 hypothetical protein IX88_07450 [Acinetobacter baumannii]ARN31624.1 hypothetical protein A4U85_13005 [Acinetobacter baumannii]EEX02315.1 hypothetical protein HMPREF0010_02984 [Acinetobacter baumannii ATCC 19606 = CIP 70.34 = JCM 6841]EKT9122977.1 hypothetical protein [Acinetobacter baumannii]